MKAADGVLAHVSTCEDRIDRFASQRRRIAPMRSAEHAVRPSGNSQLELLSGFLRPQSAFLEIAATDCSLSLSVADRVRRAYAVAHSAVITGTRRFPANFHLIAAEGTCVPVPPDSIDVAYSDGLVDHLDLKETSEQLANVYRALARGGVLVCCARNRLLDACDVERAGPPHTFGELYAILRKVGFRRVVQYARRAGASVRLSGTAMRTLEWSVGMMPHAQRARACNGMALRELLGICLVATK